MPRGESVLEALLALSARPSARSRPEVIEHLLRTAMLFTDSEGAVVLLSTGRHCERHSMLRGEPRTTAEPATTTGSEFARLLMRAGHPARVTDLASDNRFSSLESCPGLDSGPALFVPLRMREHAPGYLALFRPKGAPLHSPATLQSAVMLAAWGAIALENLRLAENVERLAVTDDLTQVYNYRFLKTALRREVRRAGRFRQDLALVMIDVDNLKSYNDRHGHLRGSHLLKEIAGLLAAQVRSFDLVAKYGGDEFTLILPQTGREGAMVVGERARAAVQEHAFPLAAAGKITVSLGVAVFPQDATDGSGLIQASDRALYLAKQQGRNRVETVEVKAA
jgi:diguanylate cyclase (GGDEF)-like protein